MNRNRFLASTCKVGGLVLLMLGQVLAVSVINTTFSQSLHILLSVEGVGIIMSTYGMTTTIGRLLFGKWIDRVGAKRLLLWSLPLMAVTLCGYPLSMGNIPAMTVVCVIHGITYALILNTIFLVTRRSVSEHHQARMSALAGTCVNIGSGLAMPMALWLAKTAFLWKVVIALGFSSVIFVFTGLGLLDRVWLSLGRKIRNAVGKLFTVDRVKEIVDKQAFFIALPGLGINAAYLAFLTWFANYWSQQPGLVLAMPIVGDAAVALTVMPWLAKKAKGYFPLMAGSNLLMVVCLLLIWKGNSLSIMVLAGFLIGIAVCGNRLSITEAISRKVNRTRHGVGFATSGFMMQQGGVIGTSYSSMVWGYVVVYMWPLMIPLLVLSFIFLLFIQKKSRSEGEETTEIRVPKLIAHYRSGLAFNITQAEDNQARSNLLGEGIDLDRLPQYSPGSESKSDLCENVVQALEYLEWVKLQESRLPVIEPIFRLQELLLQLMMELEPDQEYPDQSAKKRAVHALHAEQLEEISKYALHFQQAGFKRNEQINEYHDSSIHIGEFDYSQTGNLLRAVEALGVVDVSKALKVYNSRFATPLVAA